VQIVLAGILVAGIARLVVADELAVDWTLRPNPQSSSETPAERGKYLFQVACAICHGAGTDRPGTSSLQIKYQGKLPAQLEQRTDLTPELVTAFVRNGIAMMPPFRKTELSDDQVAAIAAYLSRRR
jgi:mono/diheme cytochrome c family protein